MEMTMMNSLFPAAGATRPNAVRASGTSEGQNGLFDLLLQGQVGRSQAGEGGLGGEDLLKALMQVLHPEGSDLQALQPTPQGPGLDSMLQGLGEQSPEVALLLQKLDTLSQGEKEALWNEFLASADAALQEGATLDPSLSEGRQQTLAGQTRMEAAAGAIPPQVYHEVSKPPRVDGSSGSDITKPPAKSHHLPSGLSESHLAQLAAGEEPSLRENQQGPTKVPFERTAESGAIPVEIRAPLAGESKATLAAAIKPEAFVQEPLSRGAEVGENIAAIGSGASPASSTGSASAPLSSNPLYLPSGQMVPEEQVIQQVTGRLALNRGEGISEMTLKLHPRELGEVRLELTVEKDHVRVNLLAQNHQVQDVLERHLPRLRQALETSGLKLDEVQVGVDSRGEDGGQGSFQDQQRFAASRHWALPRQVIPLGDLPSAATPALQAGGINVRI